MSLNENVHTACDFGLDSGIRECVEGGGASYI